jgi:hypothetical protein
MENIMKRRDFLKIGVGTVVAVPMVLNESASPTVADAEPIAAANNMLFEPVPSESLPHGDWSVKFRSVKASIGRDTYETFYKDARQNHTPAGFLGYLLSGTDLPHCTKVDGIESRDHSEFMGVTFTGVVFASNTRQHSENRFAGYEHTGFCMSSPNSKSGMHITFSEEVF